MLDVLGGLVDPFEETHQKSQSDINFHLIHILEYLGSFALAFDSQCNFRLILPETFLAVINPFLASVVSLLGRLVVLFEQEVAVDLDNVFDQQRNDVPELTDGLP